MQDNALDPKKRAGMIDQIKALQKELEETSKELGESDLEFRKSMDALVSSTKKELLTAVKKTASRVAAARGFGLLFNKDESSDLMMALPEAATDLTDAIVTELNKDAPADFKVPAAPAPTGTSTTPEPPDAPAKAAAKPAKGTAAAKEEESKILPPLNSSR